MKFGFFFQLPCAPWQSERERYSDTLAQIEYGDRLGFDTAWLAELHFSPEFSVMSAPLIVAAAAAQRTQRIRLGHGRELTAAQRSYPECRRGRHGGYPE